VQQYEPIPNDEQMPVGVRSKQTTKNGKMQRLKIKAMQGKSNIYRAPRHEKVVNAWPSGTFEYTSYGPQLKSSIGEDAP
jgi:tellurite resistance-related uncharacterized protein